MYVVYGLVNPLTHQVFYVGMTKDLYTRYIQHLNMEGNNKAKNETVLYLKQRNIMPEIRTLGIAENEGEAKRLEAFHIEKERILQQPLANQTHWTGYVPTDDEKEELTSLARWVYQERKPLKGLLGFIYKYLQPYLIGKVLFDNHYAANQLEVTFAKLTTEEEWLAIWERLLKGEDPQLIVDSYDLPTEGAKQTLLTVVNEASVLLEERKQTLQPSNNKHEALAQKNGYDAGRVSRVAQWMIQGKSVNFILREEWGITSPGGAYQVALAELREIQKIIAMRAFQPASEAELN
jgi:predicted GIY-YIG superfamily endonuclease